MHFVADCHHLDHGIVAIPLKIIRRSCARKYIKSTAALGRMMTSNLIVGYQSSALPTTVGMIMIIPDEHKHRNTFIAHMYVQTTSGGRKVRQRPMSCHIMVCVELCVVRPNGWRSAAPLAGL